MNPPSDTCREAIIAIAVHAFSHAVQRGKRKSKYDQRVVVGRGDVVMLHRPDPGKAPLVLVVPGGLEKLAYHPGQFIMSAQSYELYAVRRNRDNSILYQDLWFVVFTNLRVLQHSLMGMLKAGGSGESHVPLMERIVTTWVGRHAEQVTDKMESLWNKYYNLRQRAERPGTPAEGIVSRKLGAVVLKRLVVEHIAPMVGEDIEMEEFK